MGFRAVAFLAAGVAAGFALGGIPARRELVAVRAERDALEKRLQNQSRPNLLQAFLPGFSQPDPGQDGETRGQGATSPAPGAAASAAAAERGTADAPPAARGDVAVIGAPQRALQAEQPGAARPDTAAAAPPEASREPPAEQPGEDASGRRRGRRDPGELLARFDSLVAAQRARTAAARSALVAQAGLEQAEVERVDAAVGRMNGKLAGYGEEVIAQAGSEQPPSPAQALGLGHDVSGILFEAQTELDAVVGDKSEDVDPSALEIWNYVDVEQWRPYVEQELARRQGGETAAPAATGGAAGASAAPAQPAR